MPMGSMPWKATRPSSKTARFRSLLPPILARWRDLTGLTVEEIQHNRLEIARQFATAWGVTVVLKGHHTIVASPAGELFINANGNPGMATAGSGDVLSGIITGLMAQGLRATSAAVAGVYIHGRCGDRAAELTGQRGLVAGDLMEYLPGILSELEND